jgi:aspartate dehydrogenase
MSPTRTYAIDGCAGKLGDRLAFKLGVIGYGTIASLALDCLARELAAPLDAVICLARENAEARAAAMMERAPPQLAQRRVVLSSLDAFLQAKPDLVIEAAGHGALRDCGPRVLEAGADLLVTSVGALADEDLHGKLLAASNQGGALILSTGAIGGLDILAAAKLAGLESVTYTSRKPPRAWRDTKAETLLDLDGLTRETIFYEGDARGAAMDYPQNANVAATLALHGAGFTATRVRLMADPAVTANVHEIHIRSACADISFKIEGRPSPANPKTSLTTAYSLAAQVLQWMGRR